MAKRGPDLRDAEVGRRVRALRLERGMSQEKLGDSLGLTFQQVQKYEKGTNRIGAGRLQRISEIFEVPISAFFEAAPNDESATLREFADNAAALRLLRAYSRISSPQTRQALVRLAETMSEAR
jgi:transcriptional regulator with XRE-family HTH domain